MSSNKDFFSNYTAFYTEGYDKHICDCTGLVSLVKGDRFVDEKGNIYEVVFKMFNPINYIMVYHGKIIARVPLPIINK